MRINEGKSRLWNLVLIHLVFVSLKMGFVIDMKDICWGYYLF
jgi:hypothetical protein